MNLEALNQKQLATLLGLTTRQLWVLQNDGLPSKGLGKQRRFIWKECFEFYLKRKVMEMTPKRPKVKGDSDYLFDLTTQQTRKYQADAARAEIKLAKERGEVVEIEIVRQAQMKVNSIIRTRVLGVPTKIAPLIAVNGNLQKVKSILESEMRELLTGLSQESVQ